MWKWRCTVYYILVVYIIYDIYTLYSHIYIYISYLICIWCIYKVWTRGTNCSSKNAISSEFSQLSLWWKPSIGVRNCKKQEDKANEALLWFFIQVEWVCLYNNEHWKGGGVKWLVLVMMYHVKVVYYIILYYTVSYRERDGIIKVFNVAKITNSKME